MTYHPYLPVPIAVFGEKGYGFVFSIPKNFPGRSLSQIGGFKIGGASKLGCIVLRNRKSASHYRTHCRQRVKQLTNETVWTLLSPMVFLHLRLCLSAFVNMWMYIIGGREEHDLMQYSETERSAYSSTGVSECLCTTVTRNPIKPCEGRENSF